MTIRTSRQLKSLVRNMSKDNSAKAQTNIRNYVGVARPNFTSLVFVHYALRHRGGNGGVDL